MQKLKNHQILICCIVVVAITLALLPGELLGKYVKDFVEENLIALPKNYYTVTIVDNYVTMDTIDVVIGETYTLSKEPADYNITYKTAEDLECWVYAGGGEVENNMIPNTYTSDMVIYPKWTDEYWLRFLDGKGNDAENVVLAYKIVDNTCPIDTDEEAEIAEALKSLQNEIDPSKETYVVQWDTNYSDSLLYTAENLKSDIIVKPEFLYNGALDYDGQDPENDGIINNYTITGLVDGVVFGEDHLSIDIPETINGVSVTEIGADAFYAYPNLHSVTIPASVEKLGSNVFPGDQGTGNRETVTIYYEGTPAQWIDLLANSASDWDKGLGGGTRVFFLTELEDGSMKVLDGFYWELSVISVFVREECKWYSHTHTYSSTTKCTSSTCISDMWHRAAVAATTDYTDECACDFGTHSRTDAKYWPAVTTVTSEEETP